MCGATTRYYAVCSSSKAPGAICYGTCGTELGDFGAISVLSSGMGIPGGQGWREGCKSEPRGSSSGTNHPDVWY
eukprot:1570207-Rhodomonas_salina.2